MNVGDTSVKGMFLLTIESHSCSRQKQAKECCLNNRTSGDEKKIHVICHVLSNILAYLCCLGQWNLSAYILNHDGMNLTSLWGSRENEMDLTKSRDTMD